MSGDILTMIEAYNQQELILNFSLVLFTISSFCLLFLAVVETHLYFKESNTDQKKNNSKIFNAFAIFLFITLFLSIIVFFFMIIYNSNYVKKSNEELENKSIIAVQEDEYVLKSYYQLEIQNSKLVVNLHLKFSNTTNNNIIFARVIDKKSNKTYDGVKADASSEMSFLFDENVNLDASYDFFIDKVVYDN